MCGDGGGGGDGGQGGTGQGVDPEGNFGSGSTFGGSDGGSGGGYDYGRGYNSGGYNSPGDPNNSAIESPSSNDAGHAGDPGSDIDLAFEPMSVNNVTQEDMDAIIAKASASDNAVLSVIESAAKIAQTGLSLVVGTSLTRGLSDILGFFGVNPEGVAGIFDGINSGVQPSGIFDGLGPGDLGDPNGMGGPVDIPDSADIGADSGAGSSDEAGGGTGGTGGNMSNDPNSYDFWDSFVDEWMGAKDKILQDDAFRKSKVEPAIGKYQSLLSDLTNQAKTGTGTYKPTTFGMGDFRSSFVPKSGLMVAEDLKNLGKEDLTSELALTDVMQPNKGNLDYLNQLKALGLWEYEMNQQRNLAEQGFNIASDRNDIYEDINSDKGTWLDAIKDIVQIGNTVGDTFESVSRWWD
jgi:hypothetical protein